MQTEIVTVTVNNNVSGAAFLRRVAGVLDVKSSLEEESDIEALRENTGTKRKRRTKAEMEAAAEDEEDVKHEITPRRAKAKDEDAEESEDEEAEEAEEETDDEESEEDEESEDEEDEAPKKKAAGKTTPKGLSLDGDIRPAFQRYAKKFSRDKAMKILKKYKVESVNDLPASKYKEVLTLLN